MPTHKYLLFSFLCLALMISCEKEESEILVVASELPGEVSPGFEVIPTYWVKFQGRNHWSIIVEPINGFDYEEEYEYVIEVKRVYKQGELMQDELSFNYELIRIISKEKKKSEGIPALISPE